MQAKEQEEKTAAGNTPSEENPKKLVWKSASNTKAPTIGEWY
jgi:hypothetical protein